MCDVTDRNKLVSTTECQGYVKIGFQRAIYHLRNQSSYEEAMRSVISAGGDTDTNACIVGGLIGAANGLSDIPQEYIDNLRNCVPENKDRSKYQGKHYFDEHLIEKLIDIAPTRQQIMLALSNQKCTEIILENPKKKRKLQSQQKQ